MALTPAANSNEISHRLVKSPLNINSKVTDTQV
jgi:hypothetical protein